MDRSFASFGIRFQPRGEQSIIREDTVYAPAKETTHIVFFVYRPDVDATVQAMNARHFLLGHIREIRMQCLILSEYKTEGTRPRAQEAMQRQQATRHLGQIA